MAKVYVRPVSRPNPTHPFECKCAEPGYFLVVGHYTHGKFRAAHYTCSKCLHLGVWDDRFDDVVCDRCEPDARLDIPYIFDSRVPDRAAYAALVAKECRTEFAMLAGMEGGCDAYNEAMGGR